MRTNEPPPEDILLNMAIENYLGFLIERAQIQTPGHPRLVLRKTKLDILDRAFQKDTDHIIVRLQYEDVAHGPTSTIWKRLINLVNRLCTDPEILGEQKMKQLHKEITDHEST